MLVLGSLCEVLRFAGEELLAPVVTGLAAGFGIWWAQRLSTVRGDIESHDARIRNMNASQNRQVADLNRKIKDEVRRFKGQCAFAKAEAEEEPTDQLSPRLQNLRYERIVDLGQQRSDLENLVIGSLHLYRDEVVRQAEERQSIMSLERPEHRRRRKRSDLAFPELLLGPDSLEAVQEWRQLRVPVPLADFKDSLLVYDFDDPSQGEIHVENLEVRSSP